MLLKLALAVGVGQVAGAQNIQFQPGVLLQAGGTTLDVGDYAIPCVTDWNGDGRKDLIVGYQPAWKVARFLNTGSDASPVFTSFANIQAGGADIYLPASGCGSPAPFVCDYDNDGKRDLLVGDGANGYVYFYRNIGSDGAPNLAAGVRLMAGGSTLSVTYRATPYICDWDGDGLKDLLCGNGDGNVFFFKNVGTAQAPSYNAGVQLHTCGTNLNLGQRAVVRMLDLDGDGIPDLVGSSTTGVYWCRNIGTRTAPVLQAPVPLRAPVASGGLQAINTGPRMRLDLVDWNNDGVIDLLVGNYDGTISYYEGYRLCIAAIGSAPGGRCALQWNSAPYLKYNVLAGSSVNTITNQAAVNVASAGRVTWWTNTSGMCMQFYRIQVGP